MGWPVGPMNMRCWIDVSEIQIDPYVDSYTPVTQFQTLSLDSFWLNKILKINEVT
jgi:hypothetical protein